MTMVTGVIVASLAGFLTLKEIAAACERRHVGCVHRRRSVHAGDAQQSARRIRGRSESRRPGSSGCLRSPAVPYLFFSLPFATILSLPDLERVRPARVLRVRAPQERAAACGRGCVTEVRGRAASLCELASLRARQRAYWRAFKASLSGCVDAAWAGRRSAWAAVCGMNLPAWRARRTRAQCSVAMISTYSAPCSSAVRSNADCWVCTSVHGPRHHGRSAAVGEHSKRQQGASRGLST